MLDKWFKEGFGYDAVVKLSYSDGTSLIYKGFRLFKKLDDTYTIQDVRGSEFYSPVKKEDLALLESLGFIKGCDIIMLNRDKLRVETYTRKIEKLSRLKREHTKNKDVKKVKICNKNMNDYIDLLFFYKTRLTQLKNKYHEE
jgi:hypothetical protein